MIGSSIIILGSDILTLESFTIISFWDQGIVQGVVEKVVTASNSWLTILIIIKSNKMWVDKYAIHTLSLVIFVYFNTFYIKPLL